MSKTILIVEDNEMNMKLFHDLLKLNGHNILQAKDGIEALEIARDRRPSLILMDIQLPGMSGLEITKLMKTDNDLKTIPVVAITALAMAGDEEKILESGCTEYISKPISAKQFLDTVTKYVG
ncbi:MAG: response regulator [Alphaproteobacteria bacterium]|jgi:two-component system cell cycle response regulator DivK|nr:response regulator [Alphaproteobacteria bacterium]